MNRFCILYLILLISYTNSQTTRSELFRIEANTNISITHPIQSAPPPTPIRNIAEFEPMEGVLIRYPLGIPATLIKEMAEGVRVYCVVSSSQQQSAENTFTSGGVNMDSVTFINCSSDEYWTRDYGPWWIVNGNEEITMVDFQYNCTWWPLDNEVNGYIDDFLNVDMYYMPISTAGGNYMTEGRGIAASSHRIWRDNPNYSEQQVYDYFEEYLGITNYHVLDDPNANDVNLDHIDCWSKFLAVDKIMIREVPQNNQDYDDVEAVVDYFRKQTAAFGTPYRIYRVYTPNGEPYTNSLILNNKVLVPRTGSQYDDDAIESYQEAMPGYEVLGFTNSDHPWKTYDALHCRAKGIPDMGMLYVYHVPLHDTVTDSGDGLLIEAIIKSYSGNALIDDSVVIFYKIDNQDTLQSVPFEKVAGDTFSAVIPTQYKDAAIAYYLHAADQSGRSEKYPYIGAADSYTFFGKYTGTGNTIPEKQQSNPVVCRCIINSMTSQIVFSFTLPLENSGKSFLTIYNSHGKIVKELTAYGKATSIQWNAIGSNGAPVTNGMYYYTLSTDDIIAKGRFYFVR